MGIVDKLLGREEEQPRRRDAVSGRSADEQALARYRYMLQTAPPETIEQAHAEAFAKLTPEQRQMVLRELSGAVPASERGAAGDDPQQLARMATRAEVRQPGILERTFGGMGGGFGFGGMMAGSFLSSMAGVVVGSMIAQQFLGDSGFGAGDAGDQYGAEAEQANYDQNAGAEEANAGSEMNAGDFGDGGGDFGGDMGDF